MTNQELIEKWGTPRQVGAHGHVRLVDVMGDDEAIVQAARVSYGKGTKTVSEDRGLIRYLMRHRHTTPSEMCEIKLHLKMPIHVARQWIRHRTASVNEYSTRYSEVPDVYEEFDCLTLRTQSQTNKQGSAEILYCVEPETAERVARTGHESQIQAFAAYHELLDAGVTREQARNVLPLATYTEFYWKIDLHNLLHFLSLRLDSHAQQEIREFASAIADIVRDWLPHAWEAFEDYRLGAVTLSRMELQVVRALINGSLGITTRYGDESADDPDPRWQETPGAHDTADDIVYARPWTLHDLPKEELKTFLESHGLTNQRERQEFMEKVL